MLLCSPSVLDQRARARSNHAALVRARRLLDWPRPPPAGVGLVGHERLPLARRADAAFQGATRAFSPRPLVTFFSPRSPTRRSRRVWRFVARSSRPERVSARWALFVGRRVLRSAKCCLQTASTAVARRVGAAALVAVAFFSACGVALAADATGGMVALADTAAKYELVRHPRLRFASSDTASADPRAGGASEILRDTSRVGGCFRYIQALRLRVRPSHRPKRGAPRADGDTLGLGEVTSYRWTRFRAEYCILYNDCRNFVHGLVSRLA